MTVLCLKCLIITMFSVFDSSGLFPPKCGGASGFESYFIMKPRLSFVCLSRKFQLLPVSIFPKTFYSVSIIPAYSPSYSPVHHFWSQAVVKP